MLLQSITLHTSQVIFASVAGCMKRLYLGLFGGFYGGASVYVHCGAHVSRPGCVYCLVQFCSLLLMTLQLSQVSSTAVAECMQRLQSFCLFYGLYGRAEAASTATTELMPKTWLCLLSSASFTAAGYMLRFAGFFRYDCRMYAALTALSF